MVDFVLFHFLSDLVLHVDFSVGLVLLFGVFWAMASVPEVLTVLLAALLFLFLLLDQTLQIQKLGYN